MAAVALPFFIFLASCSSRSEGSSLVTRLELVDSMVASGSAQDAMKELKRLEKKAYSSYERLGIYRRYVHLGEAERAEKYMLKSLRKLQGNPELSAVYSNFLLHDNRLDEALEFSECLSSTEYSGIYAECVLRKALSEGMPEESFYGERFIDIYNQAWRTSREPRWLVNSASLLMMRGDSHGARSLYPGRASSEKDILFWGTVFYDSASYAESEAILQNGVSLESRALLCDSLFLLDFEDECHAVRTEILDAVMNSGSAEDGSAVPGGISVLPLFYVNSALYEKRGENVQAEFLLAGDAVNEFPLYEPALALYAECALETLGRPGEDKVYSLIRKAGLKTLGMERNDMRPAVLIQDARNRIRLAIEAVHDPEIIVLNERLEDMLDKDSEKLQRTSRVWKLLERNQTGPAEYPEEIVRYCVLTLLQNDAHEDAGELFRNYILQKYGADFVWAENPGRMRLWECECAAWFSALGGDSSSCLRLYSYIAETYGKSDAVVRALVNLGAVYSAVGNISEALLCLNKASGLSLNAAQKAEILYRLAELQSGTGDDRSAIRSLQYALSLNENHNKARVLLKKIRAK